VGTGLIGGSIGLGLRRNGWHVSGADRAASRAERALDLGALDAIGLDPEAEITFVATPVGAVTGAALEALAHTRGVVTDVGSVKGPIVEAIDSPRFVGGHPMAGSEQDGIDGADPDLFEGAVWVLTPTVQTDDTAYSTLQSAISTLGADVVALPPLDHDALVAVVSHVPHLTAAALMRLADGRATEHQALLRLAAGGFRDMTRIASGHPGIWPDICGENREAIVGVLDELITSLGDMRDIVAADDRARLLETLESARHARHNLPQRAVRPSELVEMRVPVPDRPGVLAEVTTLASEIDVNIFDLEIAHSSEGERGVLILLIDAALAGAFVRHLHERGYRPATEELS
jgi:prephenate dehydrogenase